MPGASQGRRASGGAIASKHVETFDRSYRRSRQRHLRPVAQRHTLRLRLLGARRGDRVAFPLLVDLDMSEKVLDMSEKSLTRHSTCAILGYRKGGQNEKDDQHAGKAGGTGKKGTGSFESVDARSGAAAVGSRGGNYSRRTHRHGVGGVAFAEKGTFVMRVPFSIFSPLRRELCRPIWQDQQLALAP